MEVWQNNRFSSSMSDSMLPLAEPTPTEPQTLTVVAPASQLPHQDDINPTPAIPSNAVGIEPLGPITNLAPARSMPLIVSRLPVPIPDMITMMIQADPALENVDPTLIAMSIPTNVQRQVATTLVPTPPTQPPPNHDLHSSGSKRHWQQVVTPLSYNTNVTKKPRKQRKDARPQNPPVA
jgi:hypothetical protein